VVNKWIKMTYQLCEAFVKGNVKKTSIPDHIKDV
jgi:hypothetical protein